MHDLEAQLLDAPDDTALRLVLADALEQRGDPRGRLIQLHHALAGATVRDERIGLRAAIRELLARELPELAGIELVWELGFVRAATITQDIAALLPLVLAHPALRLVRELTLAVTPDDDVAPIAALLHARPRPSLLARVNVGQIGAGGYLGHLVDSSATVAAFAAALPDLTVGVRDRVSQAELEEAFASDTEERRNELSILQIAPVIERWHRRVELVIRDGCAGEVLSLRYGFSVNVQYLLDLADGRVCLEQSTDRTYAGYANLYRALKALAPYLEDVRFMVSESNARWVDEYAIADGELTVSRGFASEEYPGEVREYWQAEAVRRPDDHDVRLFAARQYLGDADYALGRIDHQTDGEREESVAGAREALDRALELDEPNPALWHLRGRLARVLGDLPESERCFARQAELEDRPEIAFDRALVAFAARDDDRARTLVARVLASYPDWSGARLLAAYLTRDEAQLRALLAIVDVRRREITSSREHQATLWTGLEPAQEELIRTGRHVAILDWLIDQLLDLAVTDAALCAPAAACLLGWAEVFRIRAGHGRDKPEALQLARRLYPGALAFDPLGGSVHYHWSTFVGSYEGSPREIQTLEEGLALAPEHLGILGKLGLAARRLRDHDRAIALLERYVIVFRASGDVRGSGWAWDRHLTDLVSVHYEKACFALHGVAPGQQRPPGRPSDDALDRADAALRPALALYDTLSSIQQRAHAGVLQVRSMIAQYRRTYDDALAWADRALAADDRSAYPWANKGGCLNHLGRLDEAIACCERALQLDPDHWHAHLVIACALAKRGDARDDIYARLQRVVELWPEARAELAIEPDLAALRDEPAFVKLIAG